MFSSLRDQAPTRRSRSFGVIKSGRSSKLSLLSAITATSSGSGGSASTVTQDSYARDKSHPARARRKRRTRDGRSHGKSREERALKHMLGEEKKRSVDVFEFLVNDSPDGNTDLTVAKRSNDATDDAQESDPECYYRSHQSDSGISMGSGSSTADHTAYDPSTVAPSSPFLSAPNQYSPASSSPECPYCQQENQMAWGYSPDTGYGHEQRHSNERRDDHVDVFSETAPPVFKGFQQRPPISRSPLSFRKESSPSSPGRPLYRGFRQLNSRVLLQMQANIAALQNQLKRLDEVIPSDFSTKKTKSARHTHMQDNVLRADIHAELERLLPEYYHALEITSRLNQISVDSSTADLSQYKSWITKNIEPTTKASFLSDDADMICIDRPTPDTSVAPAIIALFALIDTLIPLVIFKFVSGVLDRLIIWTLVIAAGALTLNKLELNKLELNKLELRSKGVQNCTIAFGGISLGAALFL